MALKPVTLNLNEKQIEKIKEIINQENADSVSRFVRGAIQEKLEKNKNGN